MNKIWLIIQREYLSRVKKKSFLIMTFLVPVLSIGMFALIGYLVAKQNDLGDKKKVEVVDESGMFKNKLKSSGTIAYTYSAEPYSAAKASFIKAGYDYLLYVPSSLTGVQLFSEKKASALTIQNLESAMSEIAQSQRLLAAGIDTAILAKAQKPISLEARQITETGEKDAQTWVAYGIGLLSALLIYMSLFIYGAQVMRGVIEEKVSRIVEVIISSVKPFQLMMGKIVGIGLVGLTQFVLWIVLSLALSTMAGTMMAGKSKMAQTTQMAQQMHAAGGQQATTATVAAQAPEGGMNKIMQIIEGVPIGYTIFCFLFYFLTGYLLYSAIFAAVGSAVDNETETQQFMLPITLPLVFTFIISMNYVINNPDSSLSVWLSMIPFTSPIAMMIRIPFGVPGWQLACSMALMILGFLFTTWVAARIYRVGILMYGKRASYKELAKWFMYKE
jgi:ABC-2 type transport system permease protein